MSNVSMETPLPNRTYFMKVGGVPANSSMATKNVVSAPGKPSTSIDPSLVKPASSTGSPVLIV